MKILHHFLAAAAMLLLVTALLITSFQAAAYGDPSYGFYEREYEKYRVTESLDMEMEDVMDVTEYMMAYLIGEEDELSVITDVDGQTQDFFNEQDRLHMLDVRNLFLGGLALRRVLLFAAAALLALLVILRGDWRRILPPRLLHGPLHLPCDDGRAGPSVCIGFHKILYDLSRDLLYQ